MWRLLSALVFLLDCDVADLRPSDHGGYFPSPLVEALDVHDVANLRPKISHNPLMQCQWRQAPPTPDLPFCHKISIEFTFSWFSRTVSHHLFACLRSLHGGQRLDLTVTAPATALDLAPTQLLYLWSVSPMLDDLRTMAMVIAVKLLLRSGKPTMIEKTNIVTILIRTSLAINSRQ